MSESSESSELVKDIDDKLKQLISLISTHCVRGVDKLEDQCLRMRAVVGDLEIQNLLLSKPEAEATRSKLVRQLHRANQMFHPLLIEEEVRCSTFSLLRCLSFDLKRHREINNIIRELDRIQNGGEWKSLESRMFIESIKRVNDMPKGTTNYATEIAAGRDDDKQKIIELLLGSSPSSNSSGYVPVLTICGPQGIGKSSLARTIFDDSKIVGEFKSLRLWVYVGEKFDVKTIVKKLVECLVECRIEDLETETQKDLLRKIISQKKKKFLLVLDDFSIKGDDRKWIDLKECLKGGVDGSRIIVVTREDVGISTLKKCELQGLSLNESLSIWDLDPIPEVEQLKFEQIKDKILSKCQHHPLDIEIIGKLLRYRPLKIELLPFMREILGKLNGPALPLSYGYLPPQLQQCFVYCGLFPKNELIDVEKLIHHWIAHQYVIRPDGAEESVEEIGLEYFNYLVRRSFLKEGERDELGNVRSCMLDNSVHDLAASMAGFGHRVIKDAEFGTFNEIKTRHVSFLFHFNAKSTQKSSFGAHRLRTFLLPRQEILRTNEGRFRDSFAQDMITKFRHLYVCDLHSSGIVKVPSCIQNLECLRYLDISDNDEIKFLPSAITKLRYLQVLNVSGCEMLEKLPKNIRKLVNLRHLYCHRCWNLKYMPHGIGDLTQLRTLSWFVVAEDASLFAHIGGLKELGGLQNLREVEIRNLKHLNGGKSECEKAKLKEKVHLQSLTLRWNHDEDDNNDDVTDVVDFDLDLQLNENLKRLKVSDYKGKTFPVGFSLLKSLVHVSIKNCTRCERLPALDHIETLKCLSIENLPCLAYIDYNVGLPESLKQLQLLNCPNLEGWSKPKNQNQNQNESDWEVLGVEHFQYLSSKEIKDCPKFKPKFPKAQEKPTPDSASAAAGQLPQTQEQRKLSLRRQNVKRASAVIRDMLQQSDLANIIASATKWNTSVTIQDVESFPEELLKNLNSCQRLVIHHCPKMLSLPRSLKHCTSLRHLKISRCSELEARCRSQEGADWHIIAHIPFIQINSQFIKINGQFLSHRNKAPLPAAPITTTPSEATRDYHSVKQDITGCHASRDADMVSTEWTESSLLPAHYRNFSVKRQRKRED